MTMTEVMPPLVAPPLRTPTSVNLQGDLWVQEGIGLLNGLASILGFSGISPCPSDFSLALPWARNHKKKNFRGNGWECNIYSPGRKSTFISVSYVGPRQATILFHILPDGTMFVAAPFEVGIFLNHPAAAELLTTFFKKVLTAPALRAGG